MWDELNFRPLGVGGAWSLNIIKVLVSGFGSLCQRLKF